MQYSIALVAALASVAAAVPGKKNSQPLVSEYTDGQPQVTANGGYPTAYPTAPAAAMSTVYSTDEITISSCGPEVTNCPYRTSAVGGGSPAHATTYPNVPPPAVTPPAAGSSPAGGAPPAGQSTYPAVPPAGQSTYPAAPPAPESSSYSVMTISTCVPTVIYSTVPVPASQPTGSGSGSAPYPVGSSPAPIGGTGAASGTGAVPYPTSSPITPATGAAASLTNSMVGVAAAALAAIFLA